MARSPPRGASEEGGSDRSRRLRRAFSSREKNRCLRHRPGGPLHAIAWVAWVSWVAWCFGVSGAPLFLCQPKNTPRGTPPEYPAIREPRYVVHCRVGEDGPGRRRWAMLWMARALKGVALHCGKECRWARSYIAIRNTAPVPCTASISHAAGALYMCYTGQTEPSALHATEFHGERLGGEYWRWCSPSARHCPLVFCDVKVNTRPFVKSKWLP